MKRFKVVTMLIERNDVRVCRRRRKNEYKIKWYYNVSPKSLKRVRQYGHGHTPYHRDTCPICGVLSNTVIERHRNSMYTDDSKNYLVSCLGCYNIDYDQLQHDWEEYYSMTR
jgi:hypothetical protein